VVKSLKKLSLSTAITAGLGAVVFPVLVFILVFGYQRNSAAIRNMLQELTNRTQQNSIKTADNLTRPVAGSLNSLAEVASINPAFFKTEQSRNLLYKTLISADQIDAVYVSFEDGYHRVVTRMDADRRKSDARIPAQANWHSSYIDEFAAGAGRLRHRTFFDVWPQVIGQFDVDTKFDIRKLPHYKGAKDTGRLAIAEPSINPDTGAPVMSLGVPVVVNGEYIGFAGANITLDVLSKFLDSNRVSKNSLTLIADNQGRMIAHPIPSKALHKVGKDIQFVNLAQSDDIRIREAAKYRDQTNRNSFTFKTSQGEEISVAFLDFPQEFGRPWQVVVLTPTNDFVGELKSTNRAIVAVIGAVLLLEMAVCYGLSRALSQGLEEVSRQVREIQDLKFIDSDVKLSQIREVADLQEGFTRLSNALQTFAQYVPLDVVRQLVKSGNPLGLRVEPRPLTILFSDLENFSAYAEKMSPEELLRQVSEYFSVVTEAIADEQGTVDKFIGDAVMAFWGAPLPREDHVIRACCGALRAMRRMEKLNQDWARDGRPTIRMRIGLNTATALVGNVGSAERLSYTVMGDGVNVASRLEGKNKEFGSTICISDSVFDAIADRVVARPLGRVVVRGRQSEFMIYELLGIRDSNDPELMPHQGDLELVDLAQQAVRAIAVGDRETARLIHQGAVDQFPNDRVSQALLDAIT
jgi:class 3 adenylate cyclase